MQRQRLKLAMIVVQVKGEGPSGNKIAACRWAMVSSLDRFIIKNLSKNKHFNNLALETTKNSHSTKNNFKRASMR